VRFPLTHRAGPYMKKIGFSSDSIALGWHGWRMPD